ncbi:alanine racemase [Plasticicumulans lactativorans]|uniref:Alanine racemase n=1 Tax=Plasticicumulans lactativorans TaxID=1133106 RepID=A0A4R2LQB0_9GAMM|nr:alanine racemase [Plasticicumulans lactativorans]TCO81744.1 alanine racemase [Plasticicumulans lactativorans]
MRPCTVTFNLAAARHNLAVVRSHVGDTRVIAVMKADAYGHGAVRLLPAFADADALAVSCIEEAMELRAAGARRPIVLLEGVFRADELELCALGEFWPAVHSEEQLRMLEAARLPRPLSVWLKLDTGMHRLGFDPARAEELVARLDACPAVLQVRVFSHLACADQTESPSTVAAIERFRTATDGLGRERSLANSGAILNWPQAHFDWVRAGLVLYGATPRDDRYGPDDGLRPVMTFTSELIAVRELAPGEPVGYGEAFRARERMRIGIVAVGYADGYPRHAPSGTPILVERRETQLVGRVAMDMLAVDITAIPWARVGSSVTMWGEGLPAERVTDIAGPYEIFCALGKRVHVRVVDERP